MKVIHSDIEKYQLLEDKKNLGEVTKDMFKKQKIKRLDDLHMKFLNTDYFSHEDMLLVKRVFDFMKSQ